MRPHRKKPKPVSTTDPSLLASAGLENLYLNWYNANKSIFPYHGKQYAGEEADLPNDVHVLS